MNRVGILIPAYNAADTIANTLTSLRRQVSGLERVQAVYLADDGSTDSTISVAHRYWEGPPPLVTLQSSVNSGERANCNRAISAIRNCLDWILLLHADDLAKPAWLSLMLDAIDRCGPEVASICSSWDTLLPDGSIIEGEDDPKRPPALVTGTVSSVRDTLLRGCWWHISGCAIRLSAFDQIGEFDPSLPQLGDWEWILRCLYSGWSVLYLPRTLILYRQHIGSVSSESFQRDRDIIESLSIVQKYCGLLKPSELAQFHLRRIWFLLRRSARAAQRCQLYRCVARVRSLLLVVESFGRCLQSRASRADLIG